MAIDIVEYSKTRDKSKSQASLGYFVDHNGQRLYFKDLTNKSLFQNNPNAYTHIIGQLAPHELA